MEYQLDQLARDVAIGALTVRVFGPAVLAGLRQAAAVGVRAGVSEMQRCPEGEER